MDNKEEILQLLEEFEQQKPKEIPRELEEYLKFVAKTGDPIFVWSKVKFLFQEKLEQVLCDYYESCPNNDLLQCPNVEQFNFDLMKTKIFEKLDAFSSAPFTIQRLSELLTAPRKEYNRTDKFMRAVEKNILVVTTQEPGCGPRRGDCPVLNGLMDTSINAEQNNVAKLSDDLKCCLKEEDGSEEDEEDEEASDDEEMSDDDKAKVSECQQNSTEVVKNDIKSEPPSNENQQQEPCGLELQTQEPCDDAAFVVAAIAQDIVEPSCPSIEEPKLQNLEESGAIVEAVADTELPVEAPIKLQDEIAPKEPDETSEIIGDSGSKNEVSCNIDTPENVKDSAEDTENDPVDTAISDVAKEDTNEITTDTPDVATSLVDSEATENDPIKRASLKRKERDPREYTREEEDAADPFGFGDIAAKRLRLLQSAGCKSEVDTVSNGQ